MRFLKKASYQDLLGYTKREEEDDDNSLTSNYLEYELYLEEDDIKRLWCSSLEEKEELHSLINKLKKNKAVISAVHCHDSYFKTSSDPNSMSLDEIMYDEKTMLEFFEIVKFADFINSKQYEKKSPPIIVIIHSGNNIGCGCEHELLIPDNKDNCIENFINKFNEIKTDTDIIVTIENITPYYNSECGFPPNDCNFSVKGHTADSQKELLMFVKILNSKLAEKNKSDNNDVNLDDCANPADKGKKYKRFGICVDFCHVLASKFLSDTNQEISEEFSVNAINEYFENSDFKENDIDLFHISNYDYKKGNHGFSFNMSDDIKVVETIRKYCNLYSNALATFEVSDGEDYEKSKRNFDEMMLFFSNKHVFGKLSELLSDESNKDLKQFFDDLYSVYSCNYDNHFEILKKIWAIKKFIIKNTNRDSDEYTMFGFGNEITENQSVALLRMRAYVFYARFCNLGEFLAQNYYTKESFLDKHVAEDFGLSMKYFMFNDISNICVYTGIKYNLNPQSSL